MNFEDYVKEKLEYIKESQDEQREEIKEGFALIHTKNEQQDQKIADHNTAIEVHAEKIKNVEKSMSFWKKTGIGAAVSIMIAVFMTSWKFFVALFTGK